MREHSFTKPIGARKKNKIIKTNSPHHQQAEGIWWEPERRVEFPKEIPQIAVVDFRFDDEAPLFFSNYTAKNSNRETVHLGVKLEALKFTPLNNAQM